MKLVVVSYKVCWYQPEQSESGYVTVGGFPFQMEAISQLFEQTKLVILRRPHPVPMGALPIMGNNLIVNPLPEPPWKDLKRKIALLVWLPVYLPQIWKEIKISDVVHTPVPGDVGVVGLIIALLQRKRLFIRYCGPWGKPATIANKILHWLLERIAGERVVVLATGGDDQPPSQKNLNVKWIFSTSLKQIEFENLPAYIPWVPGNTLHLIHVARLDPEKNTGAILQALTEIRSIYLDTTLDIVGDGDIRSELEELTKKLGLQNCVHFHGNVDHDQVMNKLSSAHIFIFPSFYEGFPKAVLEALACGLPVVATGVSVIPYLLREGSGLVLEDTSSDSIVKALGYLIHHPDEISIMSQKARLTAQKYTLEAWGAAIGRRLEAAWGPLKTPDKES